MLRFGRLLVEQERVDLGAQLHDRVGQAAALGRPELEGKRCRAQRVVDADEHLPQSRRLVGREQLPAIRLVSGTELLESDRERLALDHARLRLVEHAESRIDSCGERIGGQQAPAEPVNGGDPGAVEIASEVGPSELLKMGSDPRAQLSCRTIGVRDHEQRVDVQPVLDHGPGEALDEHRRLAGAGPGGDKRLSPGGDGRALLWVEGRGGRPQPVVRAHGRSLRHMRQRVHQAGHSPPRGSWITSPTLMRSARATAVSRAWSISVSNAGPSR